MRSDVSTEKGLRAAARAAVVAAGVIVEVLQARMQYHVRVLYKS